MANAFYIFKIMLTARRPSHTAHMRAVSIPFWLREGYDALTFFGTIITNSKQELSHSVKYHVCLRQYNNNQDITVDGIRVATTWADAVAPSAVNQANAPTFSPAGGIVTTPSTSVTLSCTTPGASIYYTLDGSTPDR